MLSAVSQQIQTIQETLKERGQQTDCEFISMTIVCLSVCPFSSAAQLSVSVCLSVILSAYLVSVFDMCNIRMKSTSLGNTM